MRGSGIGTVNDQVLVVEQYSSALAMAVPHRHKGDTRGSGRWIGIPQLSKADAPPATNISIDL
jgi:hypothetical protein